MADLVMGAMPSIIPKLYQLLEKEYNLQTGVKERITSLTQELEVAQAALRKVAQVPWDQLDEQVQIWARQVREASYDMEDVLDTFLVRVQGPESAEEEQSLLKHFKKMTNFFKKTMARRKISGDVMDIMTHLQEVTERCRRYKVHDIVPTQVAMSWTSTVDPRLHAMYTQMDKLVGIDESSVELKSKLQLDDMSNTKMKTVSIVGIGGLGKTTLAKAVYDNHRGDFNCRAFVSVGRNPDLQKVLQMILVALDKERYQKFNFAVLQDITQFIDELQEFLHDNKRYFIVIDDLWEKQSWETLKLATAGHINCEGRIIITTRKWEVAKNADEVYELPPLPHDSSRKLFYSRIYGDERKYVDSQTDEVFDEILRKCAGIPLAIITLSSVLVAEPRDRWFEVYKSIGFGCKENEEAESIMKKILSFSYYDLPSHLRTCLLYLSAFPEDSVIPKVSLVWMWVAEGFVQKQKGKGLFETGEGYFNDLSEAKLTHLAKTFSCATGKLPFTYLGLPLSLTKPKVIDFTPLVNRCERRLVATSAFLSQAGRLELTNSVFSSLPTFCMSTYLLQQTVIEQIDKFRKHCLWRGADINAKQKPKAAWPMVCRAREEGGLGVLNIKTQNEALLIKHLHKFFNKEDLPWVSLIWECHYSSNNLPGTSKKGSFWWRDVLKLLDKFKGMAKVRINDGNSCMFWEDLWGNDTLAHKYPELLSFAKKKQISFNQAVSQIPLHGLFHLPLSQQAHSQLISLQGELNQIILRNTSDSWSYIWNSSIFSVRKTYKHLSGRFYPHQAFKWLWRSSCQNKHKVFFWLLLKDRISTRELLKRKNMILQDYNCILCSSSTEESLTHLFLHCPFAVQCWAWLNVQVDQSLDPFQTLQSFKDQLPVPFFMEIIIIMCWTIWKVRNDMIFRQVSPRMQNAKEDFRKEFELLLLRVKKSYSPQINIWTANLA